MGLSKAFDTISHMLMISKLHAYGFNIDALEIIFNYLRNRSQRVKINNSFSTCEEAWFGMPQGSILGIPVFNIYPNDIFLQFTNTDVCNIANDTTSYACNSDLNALRDLENGTLSAIV